MIFQITLLQLPLDPLGALHHSNPRLQCALASETALMFLQKKGHVEDISNFIEDGKELAGDVKSGNINQIHFTKIYFKVVELL